MSWRRLVSGSMGLLAAALGPRIARAGDGLHPRTPVLWNDTPCMELVDRSVDPVLELHYDIPNEDTGHTADEVGDSRTQQFLAICRQHNQQLTMPDWIATADVDDAAAHGLVDPASVPASEVMETSTTWAGCWTRITADDARRPITFAEAAMPVPWDTTGLPAGTYVVLGYTYEPPYNIWRERKSNVVKVHDGDPTALGPSVAVISDDQAEPPYLGAKFPVTGCVDTIDGSTLTAYYASTQGVMSADWNPSWVAFAENVPVTAKMFSVDFVPPEEVGGQQVGIRVDVTDPMGRTYTAYRYDLVSVLSTTDPGACDTGGSFLGMPGCAGSSGGGSGGGTTAGGNTGGGTAGPATTGAGPGTAGTTAAGSSGGTTGAGQTGSGSSGCGCEIGPRRAATAWLGLAVLVLARRRRGRR